MCEHVPMRESRPSPSPPSDDRPQVPPDVISKGFRYMHAAIADPLPPGKAMDGSLMRWKGKSFAVCQYQFR